MHLKKLVVVRGGSYEGEPRRLTSAARHRLEQLSWQLVAQGVKAPVILSSPVSCARQSAEILSRALRVGFFITPCLEADEYEANTLDGGRGKLASINELVLSHRSSHLILVTHDFIVAEFPEFFLRQNFGHLERSTKVSRGEGWLINCEPLGLTSQPPARMIKVGAGHSGGRLAATL